MTDSLPSPKTDEEHLAFLKGLSALMVRFALDWSAGHPGPFSQALKERTFFVNLGTWHRGEIYDNPEVEGEDKAAWEDFLDRSDALAARAGAEEAILSLLPPDDVYFLPRVARDQAELHHPERGLAARKGCLWTFAVPGPLEFPEDPDAPPVMEFHIANHRYPGSFLRDPGAVVRELRDLAVQARGLGFAGIGTRSWLNDVPAWLECFPAVWKERRSPQDFEAVGGHLGCWGQTVTARQTLSTHADQFIRRQGRFEFAMRTSWLTVEEMMDGIPIVRYG